MPPPKEPAEAPKKGSAREKMFETLRSKAKPEPGTEEAPAAPAKKPDAEAEAGEMESPETPETPPETPPATPDKKGKVSPWKLVEEYKQKLAKAEEEIIETGKRAIPKADWEKKNSEYESLKKRADELEEHIRFVDYSKSKEFDEQYQKPYRAAWDRAMSELGELTVEEGDQVRPIAAKDILELVNAPLPKARELARERFGEFADDVMAHRKEIKGLFDKQASALEEAKTNAGIREKQIAEQRTRQIGELSTAIREDWSKANELATADEKYGTYFKPAEGDEEGNQRLAKGFELADRAFSENPMDPSLTAEQRRSIVQRHAAVRNRAAAFGRLVLMDIKNKALIAELRKENEGYKNSEPESGGGTTPAAPANQGKGMEGLFGELRKRAK